MSIDKTYSPQTIEDKHYQHWEDKNYFQPQGDGEPYCIMIPPPNVTGTLHMGHGFQNSLMDALCRYQRMMGRKTLWQMGTDHAGIATQMVVERRLQQQGISRHDLGREHFIDKIWEWKQESGSTISKQLRRLGVSVDWSRERFTMDEGLSTSVTEVFVRLFDEGIIYRGKRLVNWDPKFHTAISDLEVVNQEEQGFLWHIRYPIVDSEACVVIATTRPETLLGDEAVAVNPDDERYQHLIGQSIRLPLTDKVIPIIADDYVDKEFGSGCVKITPAHDFNDYQVGLRHELPQHNIFTESAELNDTVPEAYQGLTREAARVRIVSDLEQLNLIEKIEKHISKVPRGDRSSVIIEPMLTDQWFMDMKTLGVEGLAAVDENELKFIPEAWTKTYRQWLENIQDWCISRQLWWGHRIPAWYDEEGKVYVGRTEGEVREKNKLSANIQLNQDDDVLDTWFSSALWPFSTLGWPEQTEAYNTFYPTNVLVTGFDIIFFWVARMVMMGLKFTGTVPFSEVYITGLIRDSQGQKMSKSKGNTLDPIDLIDGIDLESLIKKRTRGLLLSDQADTITKATKAEFPDGIPAFGTDALRFTFCALASTGRDIRFDLGRIDGYRNFCNKIWNAARYVMMNTLEADYGQNGDPLSYSIADQWIQSRLQHTIVEAHQHFKDYRFDLLAKCLYEFVWKEYCDWYLELSKPILYSDDATAPEKRGARHTLLVVLESICRLLHPLMPFITEEIWQKIAPSAGQSGDTIMLQAYPLMDKKLINNEAEQHVLWIQKFISGIRTIRSEMNIAPSRNVPVLLRKGDDLDKTLADEYANYLKTLARVESISWLAHDTQPPASATALIDELEILIPLEGLIDKASETKRLDKEINKLKKDLSLVCNKLSNPNFVERAPVDVVTKEQNKQFVLESSLKKLHEQMEKLLGL